MSINVLLKSDVAANDSDKTITVASAEVWEILSVYVSLASTGTAGNRQLAVQVQDSASVVVAEWVARAVQAASLTRLYNFAPGLENDAAFVGTGSNELSIAIPPRYELAPGWVVRIYDQGVVDAAADDMVVRMVVRKRNA